jgi:hypothetical protein
MANLHFPFFWQASKKAKEKNERLKWAERAPDQTHDGFAVAVEI